MIRAQVELVHAGVPHPEWRALLSCRHDKLASQDGPPVVTRQPQPLAPARLEKSVPGLHGLAALPKLQRRPGAAAGVKDPQLLRINVLRQKSVRLLTKSALFQDWP